MRIAVASFGLNVSPSFKQADGLTCYNVVNGIVTEVQCIPRTAATPKEHIDVFKALDITTVIVGKINIDVANFFCKNGTEVIAGASGPCSEVVEQYLTKELIAGDDSCGND